MGHSLSIITEVLNGVAQQSVINLLNTFLSMQTLTHKSQFKTTELGIQKPWPSGHLLSQLATSIPLLVAVTWQRTRCSSQASCMEHYLTLLSLMPCFLLCSP